MFQVCMYFLRFFFWGLMVRFYIFYPFQPALDWGIWKLIVRLFLLLTYINICKHCLCLVNSGDYSKVKQIDTKIIHCLQASKKYRSWNYLAKRFLTRSKTKTKKVFSFILEKIYLLHIMTKVNFTSSYRISIRDSVKINRTFWGRNDNFSL